MANTKEYANIPYNADVTLAFSSGEISGWIKNESVLLFDVITFTIVNKKENFNKTMALQQNNTDTHFEVVFTVSIGRSVTLLYIHMHMYICINIK